MTSRSDGVQSFIHHIGHKRGQAFARWACTVCAVWHPHRNGRWAHWLLDVAVHLVLVLVGFMTVEGGGRKDYFLFCFYLDSIILESDAQQTLPLCEWSLEQCVLFFWELIQRIKIGLL